VKGVNLPTPTDSHFLYAYGWAAFVVNAETLETI